MKLPLMTYAVETPAVLHHQVQTLTKLSQRMKLPSIGQVGQLGQIHLFRDYLVVVRTPQHAGSDGLVEQACKTRIN
jgi:hypothetical protein